MTVPVQLAFNVVAAAVMVWLAGRCLLTTSSLLLSYPLAAKATVAEVDRHGLGTGTTALDTDKVTVTTKDGQRLTFHCDTSIKLKPAAEIDVLLSSDSSRATTPACRQSKALWLNLAVGALALVLFLRLLAGLQGPARRQR